MTKFDNVLGEAAHAIAGHGFNDGEFGSLAEGDPYWNGLVQVSATSLLNVGERTLADRLTPLNGGASCIVWLRESAEGYVYCHAAAMIQYGQHVIDMFEQAERAHLASVGA